MATRRRLQLTQEKAKELFDYHEDGYLIWKNKPCKHLPAGIRAGHTYKDGYTNVNVEGVMFKLHRLIFLWHYGYLPEGVIDHVDKDNTNNKISNLKERTQTCNLLNSKLSKANKSGIKGVFVNHCGRFKAYISANNKRTALGTFDTLAEAAMARYNAEVLTGMCDSNSTAHNYLINNGLLGV